MQVAPTLLATVASNPNTVATYAPGSIPTLSIMLTPGTTPMAITTPGAVTTLASGMPTSLAVITLAPTATAAPVGSAKDRGDKCEYVDQTVDDGTVVDKGADIEMVWKMKNTGTTTWTKQYYTAFWGGDRIGDGKPNWYFLTEEVKPGELAKLVVDMKGPSNSGKYHSIWFLLNDQRQALCSMDVTINVN